VHWSRWHPRCATTTRESKRNPGMEGANESEDTKAGITINREGEDHFLRLLVAHPGRARKQAVPCPSPLFGRHALQIRAPFSRT
jgi:hypothetical protein